MAYLIPHPYPPCTYRPPRVEIFPVAASAVPNDFPTVLQKDDVVIKLILASRVCRQNNSAFRKILNIKTESSFLQLHAMHLKREREKKK